jgi:hypothetical protein
MRVCVNVETFELFTYIFVDGKRNTNEINGSS